jgi:hypothetical protein
MSVYVRLVQVKSGYFRLEQVVLIVHVRTS